MVRRKSDANLRNKIGYTQKEVARAAGVSLRTVQRYEAGKSKNAQLAEYYAELKSNKEQIIRIQRKSERARKRYEKLVEFQEEKGIRGSQMRTYYESQIGGKTGTLGKSDSELTLIESRIDKYLGSQTSSKTGYKAWEQKTKAISGERTREGNIDFWELHSLINSSSKYKNIIMSMGYAGTISKQIEAFIIEHRDMKHYSYSEILDLLKDKLWEEEEKRAERESQLTEEIF